MPEPTRRPFPLSNNLRAVLPRTPVFVRQIFWARWPRPRRS